MFIVILAVVALTDYVITLYCIVNLVTNQTVKTEETLKAISQEGVEGGVMEHINDDKEYNVYIDEQNVRIAILSCNVDEILSNIDSIIEKNKAKQGGC